MPGPEKSRDFPRFYLACASEAAAQRQSKPAVKCIKTMTGSAKGVPGAVFKQAAKCIKEEAGCKLPQSMDVQSCLSADRDGKVLKARVEISDSALSTCGQGAMPDFGLTNTSVIADARVLPALALVADIWGVDLQAAMDAASVADPKGKCASAAIQGIAKAFDRADKAFAKCVSDGLKAKSDPITGDSGIVDCFSVVADDTDGKIGKEFVKLRKKLESKFSGAGLEVFFPGLTDVCSRYGEDPSTMDGLLACTSSRLNCRICKAAEDVHDVDANCSLFDDGVDAGPFLGSCPACGNGALDPGEQCDGGNTVNGNCCDDLCQFEPLGQTCDGPSSECTAALCNGAGTCSEEPANEGLACDDGYECSVTSSCSVGECTADEYLGTGQACTFSIVGGSAVETRLETKIEVNLGGDICADWADFGADTVVSSLAVPGDLILTSSSPSTGDAGLFAQGNVADGGDVMTDRQTLDSRSGAVLPGTGTTRLEADTVLAKIPAPGFYDSTGTDPRVAVCNASQSTLIDALNALDALVATRNMGDHFNSVGSGQTATLTATQPGLLT